MIVAAAKEAIAGAGWAEGLESAWGHRVQFPDLRTIVDRDWIWGQQTFINLIKVVSLDELGLKKKQKNLFKTIYCGDNSPGMLVKLWGPYTVHTHLTL